LAKIDGISWAVIFAKGIFVDLMKIGVVLKWKKLNNMTKIHSVLGLVGHYKRGLYKVFFYYSHSINLTD
jgi:hypothetical protein